MTGLGDISLANVSNARREVKAVIDYGAENCSTKIALKKIGHVRSPWDHDLRLYDSLRVTRASQKGSQ
jgi:hypothetical protein